MLIGILGGGQLARMTALAGIGLGLRFRFLDPSAESPARECGELVVGGYDDAAALERFARGLDVVTCEFENVPVGSLEALSSRVAVRPCPRAFSTGQDRANEKSLFESLSIPAPEFALVRSLDELRSGVAAVGVPSMLKACRMGYDGKGQARIESVDEPSLRAAWVAVGERASVLERRVSFTREASMICVRGLDGGKVFYPLVENVHERGILKRSIAPSEWPGRLEERAREHAGAIADSLGYVGVLAVEFFVEGEGDRARLIANEIAPRVHNSGHWTIEGAETSQFENHLRAILGLPLGSTSPVGWSAMVNLIGGMAGRREALAIEGAHLHDYGKGARPGRKVGHITVRRATREGRREGLALAEALADAVNVLA